ncbi:MAG: EF-hand domain-containing protein [Planctomycetota bacterium]|jgi:Ca2+-binding EF-hand superfamily protein
MRTVLILTSALVGLGCQAPAVQPDDPAARERPEESDEMVVRAEDRPYAVEETTVWVFLQQKYDVDADGAVTAGEYRRSHESFVRLDRDRDGQLTADDFRRSGRMTTMVAQRTVLRTFQVDDQPRELRLEELQTAFDTHDTDGDGQLSRDEFEAARGKVQPARAGVRPMPPGMRPYAALLEVADTDASLRLSKQELIVFFHARDDGDGVWQLRRRQGAAGARRPPGAPEGRPAPDFTLKNPEGRGPVTLSAFAGRRPVALIFGSYT